MFDSLELYKETLTFAKNSPMTGNYFGVLRNYYLQLVTTVFFELTAQKVSPLMSVLCSMYRVDLTTKNFSLPPAQVKFTVDTGFDLLTLVYGLNIALAENLTACSQVFDDSIKKIFRGAKLSTEEFQTLYTSLNLLDDTLGTFQATEKIVEKRVEVPAERVVEKRIELPAAIPDVPDKDFTQNLDVLAKNRKADDERIIVEIKKVQLALQDELSRLQGTLKNISGIRDGIDFKTLEEPIYQLVHLFEMISETAQRHPQADALKGYENLIKRCRNFSRYVEQSLAMLGAQLIKETNVVLDPAKHKVTNSARPSSFAQVSKILSVGLICKGQILRKAEVEVVEVPPLRGTTAREFYGR